MRHENIPLKIGHVLIQVDHLETAIHKYRQMGFQVVPGGLPGNTHNALIYLKDGAFLELFCTNHGKLVNGLLGLMVKILGLYDRPYSNRLSRCLPGTGGLKDYALDSVPVTRYHENLEKIRANGLSVSRPRQKSRVDQHGIRLKWTLSSPDSISLPFLMSEYQPPAKIETQDTSHTNGALGIHEIHLATTRWEQTYQEYSVLLGIEPQILFKKTGRSCLFPIQDTSIHLVETPRDGIDRIVLSCGSQLENTETFAAPPPFIVLHR